MKTFFIVWSDELKTGIPILDEQYRGLVSIINSFYYHRADVNSDISRILVPTAEMFKGYVKINFYTIEKLLLQAGYPDLEKYKKFHMEVLKKISVVDKKYRAARDADGMLTFLKNYWLKFIREDEFLVIHYLKQFYSTHPPVGEDDDDDEFVG